VAAMSPTQAPEKTKAASEYCATKTMVGISVASPARSKSALD
jgi:hypothetical protein